MSPGLLAAHLLCSTLRAAVLCNLWGMLMSRRYSVPITYGVVSGAYLLLDLFTNVTLAWNIPQHLWALFFHAVIFLLVFNLYKGQRLAKAVYIFLGYSLFIMSGMVITCFYGFLPEELQWVVNNPRLIHRVLSIDFAGYAIVTVGTFLLTTLLSYGCIRLYKRIRYKETLPAKAKFMFIPVSQILIAFAYILFAYNNRLLASRENASMLLYLLISIVLCIVADAFLFITLRDMDKKALLETQLRLMEQSQLSDYEQFQAMDMLYRREREFRHDINNRLITAQALLVQGEHGALSALLQEISGTVVGPRYADYCGNALINAVLNNKLSFAETLGIRVEAKAAVGELSISKTDLCSLLSNVMDNAVEACQQLPEGADRRIQLDVRVRNGYLIVQCENTALRGLEYQDGKVLSTKREPGRGWGLGILEHMAKQYDGELHTEFHEGCFLLRETLKL